MHWSAGFVGLPWREHGRDREGVDCWGVVVLGLAHLGISVPSYTEHYASTDERAELAALFGLTHDWPWHAIDLGQERDFDLIVFRRGRMDGHAGLCTGPGEMLHIEEGGTSHLAAILAPERRSRLTGIYRHADLMDRYG